MPKLASINFDHRILDAARDGKLVIFAGAGVSMGPPSNLPDFRDLAASIADGTGENVTEPLDRFLGQLQHKGVSVKKRAAQRLNIATSQPKVLHHDLLRIFGTVDRVRIVTTNFDLHFETASDAVFREVPDLYRAPALPRGDDFTGIVHVHGALTHPEGLILTDADFGRAYLTQGWARRFLVDVFRKFTVLFVGYSHDDTVMNYLARALPADGMSDRFALSEKQDNWNILGITPIGFEKASDGNPFKTLEDGVHRLAELTSRGVLDWQTRLTEVAGGLPPVDDEAIDEIEHAIREVHTLRFFTRAARNVEWLDWLQSRHHFKNLFNADTLGEHDTVLMMWLIENFAIEHPDAMFKLIAQNEGLPNPAFWAAMTMRVGMDRDSACAKNLLEKWVAILLAKRPTEAERSELIRLAERCSHEGKPILLLRIFSYLCQHQVQFKPTEDDPCALEDEYPRAVEAEFTLGEEVYALAELWTDHLKPCLPTIAYPLLQVATRSLEEIYRDLAPWGMVTEDWDPNSYHRSAIEVHEQDRFPDSIDVLIDAARDALEYLSETHSSLAKAWLETVDLSAPLLRRLAVHALTIQNQTFADDRLYWILDRVGLSGTMVHHEVYRAVSLNYSAASEKARQAVVNAVLTISVAEAMDWSAEKMTDWAHFAWLSWLLVAKPDCTISRRALVPIEERHPKWQPDEHPDFTHWSGTTTIVGSESPWQVEQLLARPASEQIDQLLNFKETRFFGPGRSGLLIAITKACKEKPRWALGLIDSLKTESLFATDLWRAVLRGLHDTELTPDEWRNLLTILNEPELHQIYGTDIASLLSALVRDGGNPLDSDVLEQANELGFVVWHAPAVDSRKSAANDRVFEAVNRSGRVVVEFWLSSLAATMHGKSGGERYLPTKYKDWFVSVINESSSKGNHGRVVLARHVAFLFSLDEAWTREHVISLFSHSDNAIFDQAWSGFLTKGRLNQAIAIEMHPAFTKAVRRFAEGTSHRRPFVELYTALAIFYTDDPMQELLPALIRHGSHHDRVAFATEVSRFLRHMEASVRDGLWNRWLRDYWGMRLDSVPVPLEDQEITSMLCWTAHLDNLFPEAVSLAIQARSVVATHSNLLMTLRQNDLAERFPESTARLVIYLCDCVRGNLVADLVKISERIPSLPPQIQRELKECLARAGGEYIVESIADVANEWPT